MMTPLPELHGKVIRVAAYEQQMRQSVLIPGLKRGQLFFEGQR